MKNIFSNRLIEIIYLNYLLAFIVFPFIGFPSHSESTKSKIFDKDFDLEIKKNSIPYEKYDSSKNQFDNFFGLKKDFDNDDKINFQDLSISVDSKNIRILFDKKLKEMTTKNKKNSNIFYLEKI